MVKSEGKAIPKPKVTLSIDPTRWRAFRSACIARGTSASKVVDDFMNTQLQAWATEQEALRILVQGPKEHHVVEAGRAFAHPGPGNAMCETPCPEPICRCGHFTLAWPAWEALVQERDTVTQQNARE